MEEECELCDIEVGEMHDYKCEECDKIEIEKAHNILYQTWKVTNYVSKNYNHIDEKKDRWDLPEEFHANGGGDCEDFDNFTMYLLKEKFNIRSELILVENGDETHTLILVDGQYYFDPVTNNRYTNVKFDIIWICSYEESIWMTYYYHDNVGIYY
jgi:hypothetical protein